MHICIAALVVILPLSSGSRKHNILDVDIVQNEQGDVSVQALGVSPWTQKAIRTKSSGWLLGFSHSFDLNSPASSATMQSLGVWNEWQAFLGNLNQGLGAASGSFTGGEFGGNKHGKKLVAEFNNNMHAQGKMLEWKLTFFTKFTTYSEDMNSGNHYLTFQPVTDNRFFERQCKGFAGQWERACCCKQESDQSKCKFAWSEGKCCKFKYGNIAKDQCKVNWFAKSTEKVADAQCSNGPEPPVPVSVFAARTVSNIDHEPSLGGDDPEHWQPTC